MHTKLAGHLPLQDQITSIITGARAKLAAAEEKEEKKDEKKAPPFAKKDEKKADEKKEKTASVIDHTDPEQVEKLASALELGADEITKEADKIDNGEESKQGGEQLPVGSVVGGHQSYGKDGSKRHASPMKIQLKAQSDNGPAKTQIHNDEARAPGGSAHGQFKKKAFALSDEGHKLDAKRYGAISKAHHDMSEADKEYNDEAPIKAHLLGTNVRQGLHKITARHADYAAKKHEKGQNAMNPFGGMATKSRHEEKTKKSSAVDFIMGKIAEFHGGGETLDDKPAPVPSNPGRQAIKSNTAPVGFTKREAKAPRKAELAQVLTEPAMSAKTDGAVNRNLQNPAKGGVKIAAAKALLQKIASEGCTCDGKGECKHCKLKAAMAKRDSK